MVVVVRGVGKGTLALALAGEDRLDVDCGKLNRDPVLEGWEVCRVGGGRSWIRLGVVWEGKGERR